ncbi:hypothetical protein ACHAW6_003111 [Cyclotella cf. meneghiniana]
MQMSGRLVHLLIAYSPRLLGYAPAFAPPAVATTPSNINNLPNNKATRRSFGRTTSILAMSDEVAAAKQAASQFKSSDGDGAGPPTVFDKLLSGEWPCKKVHEDDIVLAFRDINPQAPVHIVVIPKNRDGLTKLSNAREGQKDVLGHLMYVAQMVGKKECPDGFRIVINDGEHGAQSVYHLHLHVMGGRQMGWPPG